MAASQRLGLNLQPVGENVNLWGGILNDQALALLEEAIAGVETIPVSGNLTLTATNFTTNQARKAVLVFTAGVGLVAAPTISVPQKQKLWLFVNNTGFAVTFACGGTPATIPVGRTAFIICNGTDLLKFDPVTDAIAGVSGIATAAAASAAAAALSASEAATARDNAASSASSAAGFASSALGSAGTASAAAAAALAAYDSFDDRYLGAKASVPTVDNDGNALLTGAIYFDTALASMRVWSGTAWGAFVPDASTYYTKTQQDVTDAAQNVRLTAVETADLTARQIALAIAYTGAR